MDAPGKIIGAMANTDRQRYTLSNYDKLPDWLKRSWNVFMRVRIRADYKRDIIRTRNALSTGAAIRPNEVIRIQRDYELGQSMDDLLKLQLQDPTATDDELLNAIKPNLRFINYGAREILPSSKPREEFEDNERLNKLFIDKRGIDLSRTKEVTYLVIPPATTKSEIKSFVEDYYTEAAHLISAGEVYFESSKNTRQRISRVTEDVVIDERIFELRDGGTMPKDIAKIIENEFHKELQPFEINKRLNQMKRRNSRQ
jgi:hypothetical protein